MKISSKGPELVTCSIPWGNLVTVEITPQSCSQLVAKKLDFYPPPPVRHWLRARWEGHKPPGSSGFLSCGKEAPRACVCVY